jgi:hypothetical protein
MLRSGTVELDLSAQASVSPTPTGLIPILKHNKRIIPYTQLKKYFYYSEPKYVGYMETWLNVHENQYHTGTEIVDYFMEGINNVILMAEMQSGKTGTTRYVVHALQHLTAPQGWDGDRFAPENIYFVCGMNDNDLKNQAVQEFKDFIPPCNILFSKQLQKYNNVDVKPPQNPVALVIVDESHYASFRNSQVDKFLKAIDHPDLLVLSVSATAMAELATSQELAKGSVYLKPGKGYYSIVELFKRGLIAQSIDITKQQPKFIDLVQEEYEFQRAHSDKKFNIVRLPNQWYYKDLEEDLEELDLDVEFINHHTCSKMCAEDFNQYISSEPEKFTIIWIYGSLRAGKQLNTEHLGFVHDTSSSSPDIIAQSLLGRILGYNKARNYVKCYTDVKSARLMLNWIKCAYDTMRIPMGSKSITGGYSEEPHTWALHPPFAIHMDQDMRSYYRSLKQYHNNRYPFKNDLFVDIAMAATVDREDIIDILDNYQPGHCGGLMILTESNKTKSFKDHWTHNYKAFLDNKPVHCCDIDMKLQGPGKYFYVYANLNIESPEYGLVLLTYKEHKQVGGETENRFVQVKGNSRFAA